MTATPDWYPDPAGSANLRYYDGNQWTDHYSPVTEDVVSQRLNDAVAREVTKGGRVESHTGRQAVIAHGGQNAGMHLLFALLTLLSCGLFGIVWIIYAFNAKPWRVVLTVAPNGEVTQRQSD